MAHDTWTLSFWGLTLTCSNAGRRDLGQKDPRWPRPSAGILVCQEIKGPERRSVALWGHGTAPGVGSAAVWVRRCAPGVWGWDRWRFLSAGVFLTYCLRVANGGCRERRWTLCLLCTSAVLMYILLLLELGFFPLFLFSWKKKKKKDWTYHFNRKFPIFPLQIESDYKLTLGSTGPRRMCPFPQDRRMLVEQLIGRLSCCQISPASNWFILQWITYSSSWNLLHGSKGWFGSEEAVWSASELHIKSTNLMLGWRRHCLWKSKPL